MARIRRVWWSRFIERGGPREAMQREATRREALVEDAQDGYGYFRLDDRISTSSAGYTLMERLAPSQHDDQLALFPAKIEKKH